MTGIGISSLVLVPSVAALSPSSAAVSGRCLRIPPVFFVSPAASSPSTPKEHMRSADREFVGRGQRSACCDAAAVGRRSASLSW